MATITFSSSAFANARTFCAVEADGRTYRGTVREVEGISFMYLDTGLARSSRNVQPNHKAALRADIIAAHAHATRGRDLGVQHDMHVEAEINSRTPDLSGLANCAPSDTGLRLGTELHPDDARHVLAAYVYRFTGDHKPAWARKGMPNGTPYPLQFVNDRDWLAHTSFAVRKDGRLDGRNRFCSSHPTWPNNPELRRPAI